MAQASAEVASPPAEPLAESSAERREAAIHRHTGRFASRVGILLCGDVLAILLMRAILRSALPQSQFVARHVSDITSAGPLANPGRPGSTVFWVALLLALAVTGSYSRHRALNSTARMTIAAVLATIAASIPLAAVIGFQTAIVETSIIASLALMAIVVARRASELFLRRVWPRHRGAAPAIFVARVGSDNSAIVAAVTAPGGDYHAAETLRVEAVPRLADVEGISAGAGDLIARYDAEALVLCAPLPEPHVRALLNTALSHGCQFLYQAQALHLEGTHTRLVWYHDQPFFELGSPVLKASAVTVKRLTDLVGGTLLLAAATPLLVLIAVAIKIDSTGPVFFWHDRPGLGGKRFCMLKFRTMRVGANEERDAMVRSNPEWDRRLFKLRSDPRVTKLGGILRRWSLDELPQLWNVLRGEMSLVGPRPFIETGLEEHEDFAFRRLDTKPGITGLWQVSGRSHVLDFEDVMFLDRQYVEQWSFWLDLSIMFRTIPAIVRRTGAY